MFFIIFLNKAKKKLVFMKILNNLISLNRNIRKYIKFKGNNISITETFRISGDICQ